MTADRPADLPLPENAITAAAEAAARMLGHQLVRYHYDVARTVLTAAAPVLRAQGAAAEHERIRQLAIAEGTRNVYAIASGALYDFADLLAGDAP